MKITNIFYQNFKALPQSKLVIVPDAGHSMGEVGIAKELVDITNKYR
jgi:hypothetical protein